MATKRDYYEILGVKRGADADAIRSAYRKLARKLHPDVNKQEDASRKFAEVQEAYDVLSDDDKRKAYDRFGHAGVGASSGGGAEGARGGYGAGGVRWSTTGGRPGEASDEDLSSIFEQMFSGGGGPFGGGAGRTRGPRAQPRPRRGRDQSHNMSVAFNTAASGGTQQIRMSRDGSVQTIDVKIPAGIESGAKLRVRGKGEPAPPGGKPGDLILTIDVAPHPYFRRDGLDVYIDVPITIAEAGLGVMVTVPLLSGSVELRIPPGTSSGQKLRIKGKGITNAAGRSGNQFAVVQIVGPKDLSDSAQAALREIGEELKNPRNSGPWTDSQ